MMSYICEKIMYCLHMIKRCLCYILGLLRRYLFGNGRRTHTTERTKIRYQNHNGYQRVDTTDSDDDEKFRILEELRKRKQDLQKRQGLFELFEKRKQYVNGGKLHILQGSFKMWIEKLLKKKMSSYLHFCLQVGTNATTVTTKEQYRAYGLLLSACNLKPIAYFKVDDAVQMPIVRKVLLAVDSSYPDESHLYLKEHVIKAVRLSQNILTLIPPLIVLESSYYDESQHDTFRKTWDETKESDHPLYYYRPVLVYGNDQNVAVKGLVANCEVVIQ